MNIQKTTPSEAEMAQIAAETFKEMEKTHPINYGIMTDGLCATPNAQHEFDADQKGKPPLTE